MAIATSRHTWRLVWISQREYQDLGMQRQEASSAREHGEVQNGG
jgi:hypothetical protein